MLFLPDNLGKCMPVEADADDLGKCTSKPVDSTVLRLMLMFANLTVSFIVTVALESLVNLRCFRLQ